jgi:hypothetical protein
MAMTTDQLTLDAAPPAAEPRTEQAVATVQP